jgi:hypothetical protein
MQRIRRHPVAAVLVLALLIGAAGLIYDSVKGSSGKAAGGGGRIYWGGAGASGSKISWSELDGSGGADLSLGTAPVHIPSGVAPDPAHNRIYWANASPAPDGSIAYASLDGGNGGKLNTGSASVDDPHGVTIDSDTGRIYWANSGNDTISWAKLDGGGGGDLKTTGADIFRPEGVAIDPGVGKIYWANQNGSTISYANLDGSGGGGTLSKTPPYVAQAQGVAIDPVARKIYWTNWGDSTIGWANLDDSAAGTLPITASMLAGPFGLAVDPEAGKIYWTNHSDQTINYANLDGSGPGTLSVNGATHESPNLPALLKPPSPAGGRNVAGAFVVGAPLTCSGGAWAPDLYQAQLYRAPVTVTDEWLRDGAVIQGAGGTRYLADRPGAYACRATATNPAGSATQTSPTVNVTVALTLGGAKLNKKKGNATLSVSAGAAGTLQLAGKDLAPQAASPGSPQAVSMLVTPTGRSKKKLNQKGKVSVTATVTFTPTGGQPSSSQKTIKLKKS